MRSRSVAVLDTRSSDVSVVIGERGVNSTFVMKAIRTEPHSGIVAGEFLKKDNYVEAVEKAFSSVKKVYGDRYRVLYVGVPGEFTHYQLQDAEISFPQRRKIGERDIGKLYASQQKEVSDHRFIRAASALYLTADDRIVTDPIGISSTSLKSYIAYFHCAESFASLIEEIFEKEKLTLRFLPTQLAMATYLVPPDIRDSWALFMDVGYFSLTLMVLHGNGVLDQTTYVAGEATVVSLLMKRLNLSEKAAAEVLLKTNLFSRANAGKKEFYLDGEWKEIDLDVLVKTVKEGLDELCALISQYLEQFQSNELDKKPIYVSGEGLYRIRGAFNHVSERVDRVLEPLAPNLPFYNKPSMSSYVSLVNMACDDNDYDNGGFFSRIFHI